MQISKHIKPNAKNDKKTNWKFIFFITEQSDKTYK